MKKFFGLLLVVSLLNSFVSGEEKKIAFVNISAVLAKYQKRADIESSLKQQEESFLATMKLKTDTIKELNDEMQAAKNPADKAAIEWELTKSRKELKFSKELFEEKMQQEFVRIQLEMIGEIKETISVYGVEQKYFLILQTQPAEQNYKSIQEALLQINLADVLYHDKKYEITPQIIEVLNRTYQHKKKMKEADQK